VPGLKSGNQLYLQVCTLKFQSYRPTLYDGTPMHSLQRISCRGTHCIYALRRLSLYQIVSTLLVDHDKDIDVVQRCDCCVTKLS
jgi:hypothetical protein